MMASAFGQSEKMASAQRIYLSRLSRGEGIFDGEEGVEVCEFGGEGDLLDRVEELLQNKRLEQASKMSAGKEIIVPTGNGVSIMDSSGSTRMICFGAMAAPEGPVSVGDMLEPETFALHQSCYGHMLIKPCRKRPSF